MTNLSTKFAALLEAAVRRHDEATAGCGVWLGAEPTFTRRDSEAPEWLYEALGEDKERRARDLLRILSAQEPGAVVMRPLGRQYPGEDMPRFCYGLYAHRDGAPIWSGPRDRLVDGPASEGQLAQLAALRDALVRQLHESGHAAEPIQSEEANTLRMVFRLDAEAVCADPTEEPRVARPTVHAGFVEDGVVVDDLAREGAFLLLLHAGAGGPDANEVWLELPGFAQVSELLSFLRVLERACTEVGVSALGLRGFAPPVDDSVAWTTLTPDPAVLEVNQAPQPDMASFHRQNERLFAAAAEVGLSPYRLHYNGEISDSGGGGQLTFGGHSPAHSPFFTTPELLPRLVRYVVRHPSLSYWFATRYLGGSSQSPRPDEGSRDAFLELEVALEQLASMPAVSPEVLWGTLRHFLADPSGNLHRSELNIEKLHNPYLPGRGCLGLVELRALAMPRSLSLSTARSILLRSIVVMLQRDERVGELANWREQLHDRFALPYFLRQDLEEVFADLRAAELPLGAELEALLLDRRDSLIADVDFEGVQLQLQQALEFWPLVGDVASQEGGGSRLVDSSTCRFQVRLRARDDDAAALDAFEVDVNGYRLPLRAQPVADGCVRVMGVRYRSFEPSMGLHPSVPAESSIALTLRHANGCALRLTLHPWRADGAAYPGLPSGVTDAEARRGARVVAERFDDVALLPKPQAVPERALTEYCLDLRRVASTPVR